MAALEMIKTFTKHAKEYQTNRSEELSCNMQRTLQLLVATSERGVFDSSNRDVVDFFVSLHEVMASLDIRSNLIWSCLSALQDACKSPSARNSLIQVYRFTPILTKLLTYQVTPDKRLLVLDLLQELTYGIKISWQESHLKTLMSLLTSYVAGDDPRLISVSLGVLVNLCYKNLCAIYTLMKIIDIKSFLKTVLKLGEYNHQTGIQVCKLMIALDCVSGGLPESEVKKFIEFTCPTLFSALKANNASLMRHIVNFFQEIMENQKAHHFLYSHERIGEDLRTLVSSLPAEDCLSVECVSILLEYLLGVLRVVGARKDVAPLLPSLAALALRWLRTAPVSTQALSLLTCSVVQLRNPEHLLDVEPGVLAQAQHDIVRLLSQQLDIILLLMDNGGESGLVGEEVHLRQSALLRLLIQLMQLPELAPKLSSALNKDAVLKLFSPLLTSQSGNSLFQESVYTFYVQALSFLTVLSYNVTEWISVLANLVKERQVQMVLAIALYTGPEDIKKECLELAAALPVKQLGTLARCMADVNKLMLFAPSGNETLLSNNTTPSYISPIEMNQLLNSSQENYLNSLLKKFEDSLNKNNCTVTSGVMELYQYKMASMSHTVRTMQGSQEAADQRATQLQHSLALTSAEVSRLHQLLYSSQRDVEAVRAQLDAVKLDLDKAHSDLSHHHIKYSQIEQNLKSKTRIITEQSQEIKEKSREMEQLSQQIINSQEKLYAEQRTIHDLNENLDSIRRNVEEMKMEITSRDDAIEGLRKNIDQMKQEYQAQVKEKEDLEKTICEKEESISSLNKQLKMIFELAAKAKH